MQGNPFLLGVTGCGASLGAAGFGEGAGSDAFFTCSKSKVWNCLTETPFGLCSLLCLLGYSKVCVCSVLKDWGKGFSAQVCAPAISSPGIKENHLQLPLWPLNFVLFPDVDSPASKNTILRTCIICFPNVII